VTDVHTREQRSRNMAAIRGKNTKPEMRVRSLLHSLGYRYRLHRKDLAGKPDITMSKHRIVIFVHGCFWHCHNCKYGAVTPATRIGFWADKRKGNVDRDAKARRILEQDGWQVMTIWECQTRSPDTLRSLIEKIMAKT
jgi:DNA mismatch endonuclease (patch repair protein)